MNTRTLPIYAYAVALSFVAWNAAAQSESKLTAGQRAIIDHVAAHAQNGKFAIFDPRTGEPLTLEFKEVHSAAHAVESGQTYYCADFTDASGTLYDLDFYLDESASAPRVVESFIHKAGPNDRIRPKVKPDPVAADLAEKVKAAIREGWDSPQTIVDSRQGVKLTLNMEEIHQSVKQTDDGAYFACVDARDEAGVLYDIDTYVKAGDGGALWIAETLIHQRDGKERLR